MQLSGINTIYVPINLLKDILVAFTFWQLQIKLMSRFCVDVRENLKFSKILSIATE